VNVAAILVLDLINIYTRSTKETDTILDRRGWINTVQPS